MKKLGLLCLCILSLVCGCANEKTKEERLNQVLKEQNYTIVDVRTEQEYQEGHVVGAMNIPYDSIDETTALDRSKTILVYCQSGKRSNIAYQTLKELGYEVLDLGAYDTISLEKE